MIRYLPSGRTLTRTLILFVVGFTIGLLGVVSARLGKIPTSLSQVQQGMALHTSGSLATNECVQEQKDGEVYFVSCGGFF